MKRRKRKKKANISFNKSVLFIYLYAKLSIIILCQNLINSIFNFYSISQYFNKIISSQLWFQILCIFLNTLLRISCNSHINTCNFVSYALLYIYPHNIKKKNRILYENKILIRKIFIFACTISQPYSNRKSFHSEDFSR